MTPTTVAVGTYWSLPGPSEFLLDLQGALREYGWLQQLLVAVPRRGGPPGLVDQLAQLPSPRRIVKVALTSDCVDGVAAACLMAAGLPLLDHVPRVSDVVEGGLAHQLVIVDATTATAVQLRELVAIVKAAAAYAHNARSEESPLQVAAVVPGDAVSHFDDAPRLAVRWWWGRLSRLDTALLLRTTAAGRRAEVIRLAAVAELAGFDLGLALHLVDVWDGDLATLPTTLLEYAVDSPELLEAPPPNDVTPSDRPSSTMLPAWSYGGCDLWDSSRVAWHASAAAKQEPERLDRLLWRAQAVTILPLLEEQRERVVAWLVRQGHGQRLRKEYGEPVEIGNVWYYMRRSAGMAKRPQMPLVDWLRDVRNDVAHLRCISPVRLQEGLDLIAQTKL